MLHTGCNNNHRIQTRIKQLTLYNKTILLRKNSSKQVDDDWRFDYYSKSIYPNLVVNEDAHACAQGVD